MIVLNRAAKDRFCADSITARQTLLPVELILVTARLIYANAQSIDSGLFRVASYYQIIKGCPRIEREFPVKFARGGKRWLQCLFELIYAGYRLTPG